MPCTRIPGGFARTSRGRAKRCACGETATLACDWKVAERKSGTCDAPICARCTTSPADGKDLCKAHAADWRTRLARRRVAA